MAEKVVFKFLQPTIGCDAEMFVKKNGKHVGSEKVIPDKGLTGGKGTVICDGFQAEINPKPSYCREIFADAIADCVRTIRDNVISKGYEIAIETLTEVEQSEFDSLSNKSKEFGCNPDFDVYNGCKTNKVTVNPMEDRHRSCGGHIHIGFDNNATFNIDGEMFGQCKECEFADVCDKEKYKSVEIGLANLIKDGIYLKDLYNIKEMDDKKFKTLQSLVKQHGGVNITKESKVSMSKSPINDTLMRPDLVIPMIDIMAGITSILIDRDPNARIRRLVYGKAGCFRYQPHGIEYRTLSNFWLKSYWLMSLVTGMARLGFLIVYNDIINKNTYYQDKVYSCLSKNKFTMKDVSTAINNNDFVMAKRIFLALEDLILSLSNESKNNNNFPLTNFNGSVGMKFFKQVVIDGYERYLSGNIFSEWDFSNGRKRGWERFAEQNTDNSRNIDQEFLNVEKE